MIKEKVINHPELLEVGVAKYLKEAIMCSKFRCKPFDFSISPKSKSLFLFFF